jgi:hypothetical protein
MGELSDLALLTEEGRFFLLQFLFAFSKKNLHFEEHGK